MQTSVDIYVDKSYDTPQYGIHYIFGDNIREQDVPHVSRLCDTVTYRESCKAYSGKYPEDTDIIDYGFYTRERSVLMYNIPISNVKTAGETIARLLNVSCDITLVSS